MDTGQLVEVLEELKAREPLFHHRHLVDSAETFDRETDEGFWEVGASGRVYSRDTVRDVVLARCAESPVDEMVMQGWTTESHHVDGLGDGSFLFTYVLHEKERATRRASIWQHTPLGWRVRYHQGTVVSLG
jgi:hypothetical protein